MKASKTNLTVSQAFGKRMKAEDDDMTLYSRGRSELDEEEDRSEIEAVQRFSAKETRRIRTWRIVIVAVLLATALTVTLTTYHVLLRGQHESFKTAFAKFSRSVGDAALQQQKILQGSFRSVVDSITVDAIRSGATWPYYTTPYYEIYAGQALEQTRAEIACFFPVVEKEARQNWNDFATANYQEWVHAGHLYKYGNLDRLNETNYVPDMTKPGPDGFVPDVEWYEYWPMWLYSPPPAQYGAVNWNLINVPDYERLIEALKVLRGESLITLVRRSVSTGTAFTEEEHNRMHSQLNTGSQANHPHSFIWVPAYKNATDPDSDLVAVLAVGFAWDFSLRNLLPDNVAGVIAVIFNDCNQTYTYEITGKDAFYLGKGDLHERKYESFKVERKLSLLTHPLKDETPGHCQYTLHIYPSSKFRAQYDQKTPEVFALTVAATFLTVALVFVVYDVLVHRRNQMLVANAARSNAVVSSLFPGNMRDRVLQQRGTKSKMKLFLSDGKGTEELDKPLADLFLETTVLFADIAGFTAWSSIREPSQVFTLLETVYGQFDALAKKRSVYKVETIGDCYVAATGIPEPRKDHALAMVRFARECVNCMAELTKKLEVTLGPDTGELGIRIGINSGPVTAGVLRGDRARFQLFGDTVNTCARIESTGEKGKIHISHETAELLIQAEKGHWVQARDELVIAKGKGPLQTYWATLTDDGIVGSEAVESDLPSGLINDESDEEEKKNRLIEWNVEMLSQLIKNIVARQQALATLPNRTQQNTAKEPLAKFGLPLEEVQEIIALPEYNHEAARKQLSPDQVVLDQKVSEQLRHYVGSIAHMYRYPNSFHSFEHATHVVMSVIKLMSRIVAPDAFHDDNVVDPEDDVAQSMHDYTFGITSDPLTQFACAFSALIHDVDHRGVPNTQLIQENEQLVARYGKRSLAEQNSLDLAWELLMDDRYRDLRDTLCSNQEELCRFRQLVVNGVMATDIVDKELKALRNGRWEKAFAGSDETPSSNKDTSVRDDRNRKATIVIEHLIQASDVAHTMQHWHVYRKWNERLFMEMYTAYQEGRAEKDPSEFWYKGEIGFFDFYIIPLAKKLKDCGVFGVSSGEYLTYALGNRKEWELRGQEITAEMSHKMKIKYETEMGFL